MESYLRMPIKPEEVEAVKNEKKVKQFEGGIATANALVEILDKCLDSLKSDEAVEIHVYQEYVLIGKRQRGHRDEMKYKFTNFGFSPNKKDSKSEALAFAIRSIDNGSLPDYVYQAIDGNVEALKRTTRHLVRAYDAKIKRMKKKGKSKEEIKEYKLKKKAAERRLELPLAEFLFLSEPIIVEIPKNPEKFYDKDEVVLSKTDGIELND